MTTKTVSFRAQLKGTISDFLKREHMVCPHTEEGILELIVALSHYTEEGHSLFPQVVVCDELDMTLGILQCSDAIGIGSGPRNASTVVLALKRCAPLARGGWVVYLRRSVNEFEYGVFRSPSSPAALDIRDTVHALTQETDDMHIIVASQLAEKAVELVGACSGGLHVYLSANPDDVPSPRDALSSLVKICSRDVPPPEQEQVESFLRTSLADAVRHSHGTLIGVIGGTDDATAISEDGVLFSNPRSLQDLVREQESQRSDQTFAALSAYSSLLGGMIRSDGLVLLSSAADLVGYNYFVASAPAEPAEPPRVAGGARRRAFEVLRRLVDEEKLQACFLQSSDGASDFYARTQNS